MAEALATVVTAYYPIRSKFPPETYLRWISSFWSKLSCPLIFFVDPQLATPLQKALASRPGPLLIYPLPFRDLVAFQALSPEVWQDAVKKDPEVPSGIQHSAELYAVWYEKKEFVKRAMEMNPFKTETFVWCDAGICRNESWIPYLINRFPLEKQVPRGKILVLLIDEFQPADVPRQPDGIRGSFEHRCTVGGGILASDRAGWTAWSAAYDQMLLRYYLAGRFIGKDQNIMASTMLEQPHLAVVTRPFSSLSSVEKWFSLLFHLAGISLP
jgi:hypothetical protein